MRSGSASKGIGRKFSRAKLRVRNYAVVSTLGEGSVARGQLRKFHILKW